jgi:hypothetical protein
MLELLHLLRPWRSGKLSGEGPSRSLRVRGGKDAGERQCCDGNDLSNIRPPESTARRVGKGGPDASISHGA